MTNTTQTQQTQVVAVFGNTFPVKDDLKKLGFRFRRVAPNSCAKDAIDLWFKMDTPIWFVQTDDADAVLAQIADFHGIKVKVDGQSV